MFTIPAGWLRACVVMGLLGLTGMMPLIAEEEAAPETAVDDWAAKREETFSMVWDTVNTSYYDPQFGGIDWAAVGEKYRARLDKAENKSQLRALLTAMLGELKRTHFSILPREAAVFTPEERSRMGTIGADFACAEDGVIVTHVTEGMPASEDALQPGDRIVAINGSDLASINQALEGAEVPANRRELYLHGLVNARARAAEGSTVKLTVQSPDGALREVELKTAAIEGPWSEPIGSFPSVPIEITTKHLAGGIDYLWFNVFSPPLMKKIRGFLEQIPAGNGLVIDLRGNPGGISLMATGISGWLVDGDCSLGIMHLRQGQLGFDVWPQRKAFLGPVAVLIDGSSASTSEIFAAGLQELKRVKVFGETSAGAALPSAFKPLPTGDLFQYAVADLQTPQGHLLEGNGVVPDDVVPRTQADIANGHDPVLAAASQWLNEQRNAATVADQPTSNP